MSTCHRSAVGARPPLGEGRFEGDPRHAEAASFGTRFGALDAVHTRGRIDRGDLSTSSTVGPGGSPWRERIDDVFKG